jgi:hypothetical protein
MKIKIISVIIVTIFGAVGGVKIYGKNVKTQNGIKSVPLCSAYLIK